MKKFKLHIEGEGTAEELAVSLSRIVKLLEAPVFEKVDVSAFSDESLSTQINVVK